MSDFFSTAIELQRQMLLAQKAQLDMAQRMLDAGKQAAAAQNATQKATEESLKAWKSWASLWGWK